jgi:hypothetical protein
MAVQEPVFISVVNITKIYLLYSDNNPFSAITYDVTILHDSYDRKDLPSELPEPSKGHYTVYVRRKEDDEL